MEYVSSVQDPHQHNDIQAIEKDQHRATQWVMLDSSVSSMMESLSWPTLESR